MLFAGQLDGQTEVILTFLKKYGIDDYL